MNTKDDDSLVSSIHSVETSPIEKIKRVPTPVNCFKNQIVITKATTNAIISKPIFPSYVSHNVSYTEVAALMKNLKHVITNTKINATCSLEETFFEYKNELTNTFPNVNLVYTSN